jgi:hypothetical protein
MIEHYRTECDGRRASRLDWKGIAFWSFVVLSFAALIFALYVIWTKCDGNSLSGNFRNDFSETPR